MKAFEEYSVYYRKAKGLHRSPPDCRASLIRNWQPVQLAVDLHKDVAWPNNLCPRWVPCY